MVCISVILLFEGAGDVIFIGHCDLSSPRRLEEQYDEHEEHGVTHAGFEYHHGMHVIFGTSNQAGTSIQPTA